MRASKLFSFAGLALLCGSAFAGPFTPGNIVVLRVGTGEAALSSAGTPIFLDEYTTGGAFVQTVAAPTSQVGANRQIVASGSSTSSPILTLSPDGKFLTFTGYDTPVGTAGITGTTSAAVNRVVALVSADGSLDTTTALNDAYSANNIRGAVTSNGTDIWVAGTAATTGGVRYTTKGATTSTQLNSTVTNTRGVNIYFGQLYVSTMTGAFRGISTVGTGLPTNSGETVTLLNGFDPATNSPLDTYDFFFSDANTLYISETRTLPNGGIQKWTQSTGTWTLQYTLNSGLTQGISRLAGVNNGGTVTLYAVSNTIPSKLVQVIDNGALSTYADLATAATNTAFRGVAFAPVAGETLIPVGTVVTTVGSEFLGDLNSLTTADSDRYCAFPDEVSLACAIEMTGSTTILNPSELKFEVVLNAERLGLAYSVRMFNYDTNSYTVVGGNSSTISDSSFTATLTSTAGAHVSNAGEVKSLVRWQPINDEDPSQDGWLHCLNVARWKAKS